MTFQDKEMIFRSGELGERRSVAAVVMLPSAGLFINGGDGAPPSKALPGVIPGESLAFFDHAAHLLPHFNHDLVLHGL
jgi:hypothetical protein